MSRLGEKELIFFSKKAVFIFTALIFLLVSLFYFSSQAKGAINFQINFQGKLADSNGAAVSNGPYNAVFKLYTASSGGTAAWTETWDTTSRFASTVTGTAPTAGGTSVTYVNDSSETYITVGDSLYNNTTEDEVIVEAVNTTTNVITISPTAKAWASSDAITTRISTRSGYFSVRLGSITSLTSLDFNTDTYYLGIAIGSDSEMTPRRRIAAVPYAFNADKIDGFHATSSNLALANQIPVLDSNNNFVINQKIGVGTTTPLASLSVTASSTIGNAFVIADTANISKLTMSNSGVFSILSSATSTFSGPIAGTADGGGDFIISRGGAGSLILNPYGGNVAIGTSTSAQSKLDIFNSTSTNAVSQLRLSFSTTTFPTIASAIWAQATADAAWPVKGHHASVVYGGAMWIIGGSDDTTYANNTWFSSDGATWAQGTAAAPWAIRDSLSATVLFGKIYIMGGFNTGGGGTYYNDVWTSQDGITWTQITANANWGARYNHKSVSFNKRAWVIGGYNKTASAEANDVWWSSAGASWTQATANAAWSARERHAAVVFDNKIWIMGGYDGTNRLNDVWSSSDGVTWTQTIAGAGWSARENASAVVYDGQMWIIGGYTGTVNLNDVWHSNDGVNWVQAATNTPWSTRAAHTSLVFDGKIWVIGKGGTGISDNDVWQTSGKAADFFLNEDGNLSIASPKDINVQAGGNLYFTSVASSTTFYGGVDIDGHTVVRGGFCVTGGTACPAPISGRLFVDTAGTVADDPGDVFDLAERYPASEEVAPGDVVAVDLKSLVRASIKKADSSDQAVLGIVSSRPAMAINGTNVILGPGRQATSSEPLIALVGRVPVKASTENGLIQVGDRLTASSIPGVAMKMTGSGQSIGIALEALDSQDSINKILVFVNLGYNKLDVNGQTSLGDAVFSVNKFGQIQAGTDLNLGGFSIIDVAAIRGLKNKWSIDEEGVLTVKKVISEEVKTNRIEMEDALVPGKIYCVNIENGEWVKKEGLCPSIQSSDSADFLNNTGNVINLPTEISVDNSSTTGNTIVDGSGG